MLCFDQLVDAADHQRRELVFFGVFDAKQRQVGRFVRSHDFGLECFFIRLGRVEHQSHRVALADHVLIGDEKSGRVDAKRRPESLALHDQRRGSLAAANRLRLEILRRQSRAPQQHSGQRNTQRKAAHRRYSCDSAEIVNGTHPSNCTLRQVAFQPPSRNVMLWRKSPFPRLSRPVIMLARVAQTATLFAPNASDWSAIYTSTEAHDDPC